MKINRFCPKHVMDSDKKRNRFSLAPPMSTFPSPGIYGGESRPDCEPMVPLTEFQYQLRILGT